MKKLEHRLRNVWRAVGGKAAGTLCEKLMRQYTEPHRAYHNLEHIGDCLKKLDRACVFVRDSRAVEIALWFHDAIYDTQTTDNEEKSAQLFEQNARRSGLPEAFISKVMRMIQATKHIDKPNDQDEEILVDIDLSILGESDTIFARFENNIRTEYQQFSDREYRFGRKEFLKSFLKRPRIYGTDHFYGLYEQKARKNIEFLVQKLESEDAE